MHDAYDEQSLATGLAAINAQRPGRLCSITEEGPVVETKSPGCLMESFDEQGSLGSQGRCLLR